MSSPPPPRRAIEELQAVGLTEYEARCFVTLARISSGTAKDVSDVGEIPRSRVYDLAERLQKRGLVEIQDGSPRKFRAVSPDLAVRKLEREYLAHLDAAADALQDVPGPESGDDASGVWTIEGTENVVERGQQIAAEAEDELFGLFTEEAVFRDDCFKETEAAIDRGVDVVLGSPDGSLRADLAGRFPDATIWEPNLDWQTLPADGDRVGRLMMSDREMVMIATIDDERLPGVFEESAIWGQGQANGLVIVMQQMLGTHLDRLATADEPSEIPL